MAYVAVAIFVLLSFGSAYSYMRSRQEARRRSDMLYSELLPVLEGASVRKTTNNTLPSLEGYFEEYKIKIVPVTDTLSLRTLPRLYLRVAIYAENNNFMRIQTTPDVGYLCSSAYCQGAGFIPDESRPEIKIFAAREPENKDFTGITDLLSEMDSCTEVVFTKNFVRATFLAAKAQKGYYQVLRAAVFPAIILKQQKLMKNLKLLMELRKEVARLETGQKQMA